MQLARWPNEGTLAVGNVHRGGFKTDEADKPGEFEYDSERPSLWGHADDVWVFGAWGGRAYADNSRYLFEWVRANHPEIRAVKDMAAGAVLVASLAAVAVAAAFAVSLLV